MSDRAPGLKFGFILTFVAMFALILTGWQTAEAYEEDMENNIKMAERYYAYIRSLHQIDEERSSPEDMERIVYDIERRISEVERVVNMSELFDASPTGLRKLSLILSKMYLQLASFYNLVPNIEASRQALEKAEIVYPGIFRGKEEIEIDAKHNYEFGVQVIEYEVISVTAFKSIVEGVWKKAHFLTIIIDGFEPRELKRLEIKPVDYVEKNSTKEKTIKRANRHILESIFKQNTEIEVVLGRGHYRLVQEGSGVPKIDHHFMIMEGQDPDTIVLTANTFKLKFAENYMSLTPALFLNGILYTNLSNMKYGTYFLGASSELFVDPPTKITFLLGEGKARKGKHAWTIPIQPKSTYSLKLEKRDIKKRLFNRRRW